MAVEPNSENVKAQSALAGPSAPCEFQTLLEALASIPDSRSARGIRYPQGAVLGLCVLAFMCGSTSLSGVARFGRDRPKILPTLGFKGLRAPSVPTLSRVFGALDAVQLQRALASWLAGVVERSRKMNGRVASIDGKAVRSSGVHIVNVFVHDVRQVVWAAPVDKKANEITAFKKALADLLECYPFLELVVGDAMFAGSPLCELLIENGRHYLFQIKADQPDLLEKMGLVFAPHLHRKPSSGALTGEKKKRLRRRS
jgi:hypothetical protein